MSLDLSQLGASELRQLAGLLATVAPAAPAAPVKKKRPAPKADVIKYMSETQVSAFFRVIRSPRDTAIFRVIYHRGLRASELGALQLADLNMRDERLTFTRLKGSKGGQYFLTSNEMRALRAWLKIRGTEPGPLFPSRVRKPISQQMLDVMMKRYCKQAGIPRDLAHCHSLKHSCATHLLAMGESRESVQDHLGHRSAKSTDIYCRFTSGEARDKRLRNW